MSQPRRSPLVTDGMAVPLVVGQLGRGHVENAETPAVTVGVCVDASLAVTWPGYLPVPVPHPDIAALGAVTAADAAAAGSAAATCPHAGKLKGSSCLRGWESDPSPHLSRRFQAALPWMC